MKKFREVHGAKANKFFAFKNDARRHTFQTADRIFGLFYFAASALFFVSAAILLFSLSVMLFGAIITLGLILLVPEDKRFVYSKQFLSLSLSVLPYAIVIFVAAYAARYIFEWVFLLRETAELNRDPEENKNYLVVGKAVRKVKLAGLLATTVFVSVAGALIVISGTEAGNDTAAIMLIIIALVSLIAKRIIVSKAYAKIEPNILEIIRERKAAGKDKFGNPRPAKKPEQKPE